MPLSGRKPNDRGAKRNRVKPVHDWIEVTDLPFDGPVPVKLPTKRVLTTPDGPYDVPVHPMTRAWFRTVAAMPHAAMWTASDWLFVLSTALVADDFHHGRTTAAAELRQREKILGTTVDARRDLRIRYVPPAEDDPAESTAGDLPANVTSLTDRRKRLTGTE
jgi:hypothetical protein